MEIQVEPSCLAEVLVNKFALITTEMHRNFTHLYQGGKETLPICLLF